VFENLVELQKELSLSVQELMKLQKTYKEEEHITHDARIKSADADDKLVAVTSCRTSVIHTIGYCRAVRPHKEFNSSWQSTSDLFDD